MSNATATTGTGCFYGVGVGPGDPELLTLKALRLIKDSAVVSYLSNAEGHSQAWGIANAALELSGASCAAKHISVPMPMVIQRAPANAAYDKGAAEIRECLEAGQDVVFLCEGDPLFFGSFSYLLERLESEFTCKVVPGISSVNAAASALALPLTMQQESFAVVSGRHSDEQLAEALTDHDSVVIMKAGQARPRILAQLEATGRLNEARYLEYIGRDNQQTMPASELVNEVGPYFSLFVVVRGNRPS
ncbi:precorrin-2 C(20)-methyltransferase [Aliamphritea ceti]|uniref:precorrin-2 C(20)-methyltransferase n=1 Tax=Aliamphritea ceti TaxID=1524258 RepID=UPI0021C27259|nr:precorrin-2 C(20)-methyltransferase [Aliamphritea ceti]